MSRTVYINGEFVPESEAKISIMDRGYLFADGVYEVSAVINGKMIDNEGHLRRLERSLGELDLRSPLSNHEIEGVQNELIERNGLKEGIIYLQITRGVAERDFLWPEDISPTLTMFTQAKNLLQSPLATKGASIITVPDIRWQRRDIKSIALLPQAMAKHAARKAGANDAWMVDNGYVTEGTSTNAFIVTMEGTLVTRDLSTDILHGITRSAVLRLAEEAELPIEERSFTPQEAYDAAEVFATGSSFFVLPVVEIDGHIISNRAPGPLTNRLREMYIEMATN
ncbi:MAG: D-amino-acid transaminase [Rhodospirillaceae bacterium]|nr:D-amino-acid transaminase [Rhodospirillaceae bacterium]MBT5297783.1 D-amino-acid transaminase [Rhodospirillaceae bacterium]MBT5516216.1 D-amino-acid transaminase [Rhodospirillaceae bacterium]MBT6883071.1 D-amino-acid transaminase [Rhodospirillaceae bacterium]